MIQTSTPPVLGLRRALFKQMSESCFPCVDGLAHLAHIGMAIVNCGDAGDCSRNVVEDLLGDMDWRADGRKIGSESSAKIFRKRERS